MKQQKSQIIVDELVVYVTRKRMKNLRLAVHPPEGEVRVSAPFYADDAAVRRMVTERMAWIQKQISRVRKLPHPEKVKYETGETHHFLGKAYQLRVIENSPRLHIRIDGDALELRIWPRSSKAERKAALQSWFRDHMLRIVPTMMEKWQPIIGVKAKEWRLKRMKTKWGTCNITAKRIWLNLELIKSSEQCIEYVLVHELVHLLERYHNKRFYGFMDQFLPNWRDIREELNHGRIGDC